MTDRFRLMLAQYNPTVGALAQNAERAVEAWTTARKAGCNMIAFPEMFLTGYQTQDLIRRPAFLRHVERTLAALAERTAQGPALAIGAPDSADGRLFNAYHVMQGGKVIARVRKHVLPNYEVFDERRLFDPAEISGPYRVGPARIGSPICEDAWHPEVCETLEETGAELLLVPNGSPYARGKLDTRQALMVARVVETGLPLVYLNLVGGQDDQVFDGGSFVLNPGGGLALQLPAFEEALQSVDFVRDGDGWKAMPGPLAEVPGAPEADYHAIVLSLRDYFAKSGFARALLGLSGGVDSALAAAVAADALGPDNVAAFMLPSEYTSQASRTDAAAVADALGLRLETVPIEGPRAAVSDALAPLFDGLSPDVTEENIQSRLRGLLLMAIANKTGAMLLTTGNKSELAVGYATIYGDMSGSYNPLKDLYKTRVYDTCRWRNTHHRAWMKGPAGTVIPHEVIDKPPSAELRPEQRDDDSLPPYDVLDGILEGLVDREVSVAELVSLGHDRATVKRVEHLLSISEWKRFQAAPGTRLTARAFGTDRRYPIVNRWRDET